jgi:hypothetical protein
VARHRRRAPDAGALTEAELAVLRLLRGLDSQRAIAQALLTVTLPEAAPTQRSSRSDSLAAIDANGGRSHRGCALVVPRPHS